ncbi:hypothetical protein FBU59_006719 [Linderina macrospora]|uniref:Uncharacterized protein n=1 Tax=Linderina macrospora TaxID=4868 RepID=A0ACC1IZ18_9FUNG|nr:hypothetical protein FBU59_006719 [Linderina macrospora]
MANVTVGSAFFFPQYYPNKSAAYVVASVFFGLSLILLLLSRRAQNYHFTLITVLVALMLGGAFVAYLIFIDRRIEDLAPFTAFSILSGIAPNFVNLTNYLLLVNMLKTLVHGPSRKAITGFHIFAVVTAETFGALSGVGSGLLQETAPLSQVKIASDLLKTSIAGQVAVNVLLLVATGFFLAKYSEARTKTAWYSIIFIGGLLVLIRNVFKLIALFYPQVTFMVTSEVAWYCVDPLLNFLVLCMWAVLDMPRRCQPPKQPATYQQQVDE